MESSIIKILAIDDNQDNLISIKALIKDSFPQAITLTALTLTLPDEATWENEARKKSEAAIRKSCMEGRSGWNP